MGRRALPKIDPNIYLGDHLIELEKLPPTVNPASLFESEGPIELEVGSGKGLFMCSAAARQADRRFIGVEVSHKYARFAAYRLARSGLDNAVMISGDALKLMHEHLPDRCLAAIHVYFPDPWWKARHRKRRVIRESFLEDVIRLLVTEGRFHFWTDVQEYFDASLELIADFTALSGPHPVEENQPQHPLDYRTHFERRMRVHDRPVYRAEFQLR